jgi:hypothetical protein
MGGGGVMTEYRHGLDAPAGLRSNRPDETEQRGGYVLVETRSDRPGLVRIRTTREPPALDADRSNDPSEPQIRFAAFFEAVQIAGMHAHTALQRRLVDVDAGLYRVEPLAAVAAIDAIDLRHRRVHLDPTLAADPKLPAQIERRLTRLRWRNRLWTLIGLLAVLFLLLLGQVPLL